MASPGNQLYRHTFALYTLPQSTTGHTTHKPTSHLLVDSYLCLPWKLFSIDVVTEFTETTTRTVMV